MLEFRDGRKPHYCEDCGESPAGWNPAELLTPKQGLILRRLHGKAALGDKRRTVSFIQKSMHYISDRGAPDPHRAPGSLLRKLPTGRSLRV